MKQFLVISLLFLAQMVTAQNIAIGLDRSDLEKTSFEKAIIHFNDGTSVEGIGRLKTVFTTKEEVIIFKIEEKDKDEIWTVKDATGITIISDENGIKEYEYLKVSKNSYAELYEVVSEGSVKLYKKVKLDIRQGKAFAAQIGLPLQLRIHLRQVLLDNHFEILSLPL